MQQDIKRIIEQMTLEEKCAYVSGYDNWHTETIARLSVPAVMMSDGPHGCERLMMPVRRFRRPVSRLERDWLLRGTGN